MSASASSSPAASVVVTSAIGAITLSPRVESFDWSISRIDSPACSIMVRLSSASSGSASVSMPLAATPLTDRNSRSAKWPWTVRTAKGPTNERVSRRSVPPMPITSRPGPPSLNSSSMTGSELVSTVAASPVSTSRRAT